MTATFQPCMNVLPASQQKLWPELISVTSSGFVLYGGTAIALRLGHRTSVDFDFFSEKPLDRKSLGSVASFLSRSTVVQDESNTLSILIPIDDRERSHVKVSFFGAISFGRVGEPEFTDDGVLQVAASSDLLATKLKVILQRAEAKDYRDIAALIRAGVDIPAGLAAARLLFGQTFQPSECLKAMTYFADGDLATLANFEKAGLIDSVRAVRELPSVAIRSLQLSA